MNYFLVIFRKYLHDYSILKFKVFWLFIISLFKYFIIFKKKIESKTRLNLNGTYFGEN